MRFFINAEPLRSAQDVAPIIKQLENSPLVDYDICGEARFTKNQAERIITSAETLVITAGEYAFIRSNSSIKHTISLGTTSCFQIILFNSDTQELCHMHYHAGCEINWNTLFARFSDSSYLQMHILDGNTFIRSNEGYLTSHFSLTTLIDSLTSFLVDSGLPICVNLTGQLLLSHNMIFTPISKPAHTQAEITDYTIANPSVQARLSQAFSTTQPDMDEYPISLEIMRDVLVSFKNGLPCYHVISPLLLKGKDYLPLPRLAREQVSYTPFSSTDHKLDMLCVFDGKESISLPDCLDEDIFKHHASSLQINDPLLKAHLKKYESFREAFLRKNEEKTEIRLVRPIGKTPEQCFKYLNYLHTLFILKAVSQLNKQASCSTTLPEIALECYQKAARLLEEKSMTHFRQYYQIKFLLVENLIKYNKDNTEEINALLDEIQALVEKHQPVIQNHLDAITKLQKEQEEYAAQKAPGLR